MNIKENDQIPNSEIFILEDGEPIKKNIEEILKNKSISKGISNLSKILNKIDDYKKIK